MNEEMISNIIQKSKKRERKLKKITRCPHTDLKHYAKGMCNHCYHRYGRKGYSTQCEHTDRPAYAKGQCSNCYFTHYNQNKRMRNN